MARIRTIKPEFWTDEKLSLLDTTTRLVFLGLISMADDAGRLVDNVKLLDGQFFPSTEDTCRDSLDILASMGRVIRYRSASGQALIQIVNWSAHQKVDKPSKYVLPAPSEAAITQAVEAHVDSRALAEVAGRSRERVARVSRKSRAPTLDRGPTTKDRKDHGSSDDEPYVREFDETIWGIYPKRPSNPKRPALKAYIAHRKSGASQAEILAGVQRYAAYVAACVGDPRHIMQMRTFLGPDERWTELYEIPKPATVAGSIGSSPVVARARVLHALGAEHKLFRCTDRKMYAEALAAARADERAGPTFDADYRAVKMWDGLANFENPHFAVMEIARRLEAAGVKVA